MCRLGLGPEEIFPYSKIPRPIVNIANKVLNVDAGFDHMAACTGEPRVSSVSVLLLLCSIETRLGTKREGGWVGLAGVKFARCWNSLDLGLWC